MSTAIKTFELMAQRGMDLEVRGGGRVFLTAIERAGKKLRRSIHSHHEELYRAALEAERAIESARSRQQASLGASRFPQQ